MLRRTDTPRALRHVRAGPGGPGDGHHDPGHERGHRHRKAGDVGQAGIAGRGIGPGPGCGRAAGRPEVGLLLDDGDLCVGVAGVVGADLGAETVLERGDDAAPVGVVLGVGRGHQHHIEGQADLVAPDLHVALLKHVEQAHLDALGEVGEFVDGEDAPVGAGHQPVVQGELVGEVAALGHLDGVDLADQVGDGGVGRGQLLAVAVAAVDPGDRGVVAVLGDQGSSVGGDGGVGVVVDLGAGHHRQPLVEQADEAADHAGLGLAPLPQHDHVVAGQQGVLDLGDHRVLEAENVVEHGLPRADPGHRVAAQLLANRH